MHTGTVKWFDPNKGYGFITRDAGGDVFVHIKEVRKSGLEALQEKQVVQFDVAAGRKGEQAVNLRRAS